MANEILTGTRYPLGTDTPNIAQYIQNAVNDLADNTIPRFASPAARDTAYSSWVSAGNSMTTGLVCFTQSDKRLWWYDTSGSTWRYAGGNPPPIVAGGAGAGWNIVAGDGPGAYIDSSGLVHLVGAVSPQTTYNPTDGGTHTAATLPAGYRPAKTAFFTLPQPSGALVIGMIDTAGTVNIVGGTVGSITANTNHYLDGITFHPGYTGALPLS